MVDMRENDLGGDLGILEGERLLNSGRLHTSQNLTSLLMCWSDKLSEAGKMSE